MSPNVWAVFAWKLVAKNLKMTNLATLIAGSLSWKVLKAKLDYHTYCEWLNLLGKNVDLNGFSNYNNNLLTYLQRFVQIQILWNCFQLIGVCGY